MPKVIHNLRDTIIEEARRQALETSYSEMTMRSVADGCGIAVGTLYNYFKSKPEIVAAFMIKDWIPVISGISKLCMEDISPREAISRTALELKGYADKYANVIYDKSAAEASSAGFAEWHLLLRDQLSEALRVICDKHAKIKNDYIPAFVSENLLSALIYKSDYDKLIPILELLFD